MTTLQTVIACIALGAVAASAAISVCLRLRYPEWRDAQRAIGYAYGKTDGHRGGYTAALVDSVLLAPSLDDHADEALALVATEHLGQLTGSAAFGEALLRGELRKPAARTGAAS